MTETETITFTNGNLEQTETQRIELMKKIQENRSKQFVMNNVPGAVIEKFDRLAVDKYKGSYPAMLQELLLVYDGVCGSGHEEMFMALDEINTKIVYLQQQLNEIKDKTSEKPKSIFAGRIKKT